MPTLPPRNNTGHKGTFGTVGVIGGQCAGNRVMLGGPAFSAHAALRAGAGLAVLAMPEPLIKAGLSLVPSATGLSLPVDSEQRLRPSDVATILDSHMTNFDCLALGPGLGDGEAQQQITIRLIAQDEVPLVIDADALNCLAKIRDFAGDFHANAILTPHPGEYARLADAFNLEYDAKDDSQREDAAAALAQRLGCVVVLKGHCTVVSDGMTSWTNDHGNPVLGTGGTGDIFTGFVASFVAQFFTKHLGAGSRQISAADQGGLSLFECAQLAVMLGVEAADRWSEMRGNAGMLAMELADAMPDVLAKHRENH